MKGVGCHMDVWLTYYNILKQYWTISWNFISSVKAFTRLYKHCIWKSYLCMAFQVFCFSYCIWLCRNNWWLEVTSKIKALSLYEYRNHLGWLDHAVPFDTEFQWISGNISQATCHQKVPLISAMEKGIKRPPLPPTHAVCIQICKPWNAHPPVQGKLKPSTP